MVSIENVFAEAASHGIGEQVKQLHEVSVKHGLHASIGLKSIIYSASAPAYGTSDGSVLYTVMTKPRVAERVYIMLRSTAFAEFFPIEALEVRRIIGDDGSYNMDAKRVKIFAQEMDTLFAKIRSSK